MSVDKSVNLNKFFNKENILCGALLLFIVGVVGWELKEGSSRLKSTELERGRLSSLVEDVRKKAIGGDNYFDPKEQKGFLRAMGWEGLIRAGEVVRIGTVIRPLEGYRSLPFVYFGDQGFEVTEKALRNYLRE